MYPLGRRRIAAPRTPPTDRGRCKDRWEYIRKREALPNPTNRPGRQYRFVRLSVLQSAKAELYMAFLASAMRKAELARRLGIPKTTVDRLFDLDNHTSPDQIEAAFATLGKRIALEVQDAA